jgi:hypothetical protein
MAAFAAVRHLAITKGLVKEAGTVGWARTTDLLFHRQIFVTAELAIYYARLRIIK